MQTRPIVVRQMAQLQTLEAAVARRSINVFAPEEIPAFEPTFDYLTHARPF
jgi:hypothetical protein